MSWPAYAMHGQVSDHYVSYFVANYGHGAVVVFDENGYIMRQQKQQNNRQEQQNTSADILFTPEMTTTMSQGFLANSGNKDRLIKDLVVTCECRGLSVKQGIADADWLIVSTAMGIAILHNTHLLLFTSEQ